MSEQPPGKGITTAGAMGWLLLVGGICLLLGRAPWVEVVAQGLRTQTLTGRGSDIAPGASTAGVVALAAAAAFMIAGLRARRVILAILALIAGVGMWSALTVALDPVGAASGVVAERTGVTASSVDPSTLDAGLTTWAWLGVAASALLAITAVGYLASVGRWRTGPKRSDRFERSEVGQPARDAAGDWDALTRGEDPTT